MRKVSRPSWTKRLSLLAVAALPLTAQAGDGWYLGLEGGASWANSQTFRIYGYDPIIGSVPDGTRIGEAKFSTGWLGGLNFGYAFDNGFRSELEVAYRQNDFRKLIRNDVGAFTSGGETSNVGGNENVGTAMLNVWYDLFRGASWHPYLGGGIGAARLAIEDARWDDNNLRNRFTTQFAWQLGGGIAFDLSPHWTASIDYRYLKLDSGNSFDLEDNNPNSYVKASYDAQSAMLTLRYNFGGAPAPVHEVSEPVAVVPVEEPAPLPPPPPPPVCKQPEAGEALNLDGCKAGDTLVLRGVNFDFDKATLTLNAKTLLDQVADELTKHADIKVEIDGHTDSKGADAYNQKLSQRRADAVKTYLVEKGIADTRMTTKGFGESMPIADNNTDEGREQNRRVELKVTEGGPAATDVSTAPVDAPVDASAGSDASAPADSSAPSDVMPATTLTDTPPSTEPVDPLAPPAQ